MPMFHSSYQSASAELLRRQIDDATTKKEELTEEEQAERDKREAEWEMKGMEEYRRKNDKGSIKK